MLVHGYRVIGNFEVLIYTLIALGNFAQSSTFWLQMAELKVLPAALNVFNRSKRDDATTNVLVLLPAQKNTMFKIHSVVSYIFGKVW